MFRPFWRKNIPYFSPPFGVTTFQLQGARHSIADGPRVLKHNEKRKNTEMGPAGSTPIVYIYIQVFTHIYGISIIYIYGISIIYIYNVYMEYLLYIPKIYLVIWNNEYYMDTW